MCTHSQTLFVNLLPNRCLGSHAISEQGTRFNGMCTPFPRARFCRYHRYPARSTPRHIRTQLPIAAHVAIVGTVPDTFQNAILAPGFEPSDISLQVARSQHKNYCDALSRTSVSSLLQLPANPHYPDSIFVEDPVVIISEKTAFVAKAGHVSRDGEGDAIENHLEQLGLRISKNPDVSLDGGDVLKMNDFILVGITERTEAAAIPALQRVVDDDFHSNRISEICPHVIGIPVEQSLHLKSLVTWVGSFGSDSDGFIVAPDTKIGRGLIDEIARSTEREWEIIWIDEREAHAANVVYIPPVQTDSGGFGHVLVQETCPGAVKAIRRSLENCKSDLARTVVIPVDTSEFGKANGALTCMSVIV